MCGATRPNNIKKETNNLSTIVAEWKKPGKHQKPKCNYL